MNPSVLFVVFQAFGGANGGVESATQIIEHLGDGPHTIVTQAETRFTARWRELGHDVHVWEFDHRKPRSRLDFVRSRAERAMSTATFNARVAALVRARGFDVVHCNDISAFWHAGPGAKAAGARVVFSVRSIFPDDVPYGPKWRLIHHVADRIVCLSQEMRDVVLERFPPQAGFLPAAPIDVIYTGLDLERLRPPTEDERREARTRLGIAQDTFAIGQIAKVWPIKNQLAFLEKAAVPLLQAVPRAHVYFVGDFHPERDAYAGACSEAVDRLGIADRIHFVGFVGDPGDWYRALDVTFLVSVYEGLARAMIESIAHGVPMVAFDVTSMREVLDIGGAGATVAKGDFEALVRELEKLHREPEALRRRSVRARALAERRMNARFSAEAYRSLYRTLARR